MSIPKGPVLIELEGAAAETPASAPPVPDSPGDMPEGRAVQMAARLAARRPSRLAKFFWATLLAVIGFVTSVAAWNFVMGLLARNPILGMIAAVLFGLFVLAALLVALKEWAAFARLSRIDAIQKAAVSAAAAQDLGAAKAVVARLSALYAGRAELDWGRQRVDERLGDLFDADGMLGLAEAELLGPLDRAARREVEAAARQVATVTAVVPLALADVVAALTGNLRMIRRVAEIYGGRGGTLGSWRLTRTVFTHLVATGAVAVGDDVIQSVAGGGLLAKLSRRFGEGVINGALTARVGVAAIEVCRPLPFAALPRPRVSNLVSRALAGLFGGSRDRS